jgi:DNA repair exonuclease SbcCD ATPase subunit
MLLMQFLLLAIIGWKVLAPPAAPEDSEKKEKAAAQQIAKLEHKVDKLLVAEQTELESEIQARVLDRIVTALGQGNSGIVQQVAGQERQLDRAESEKRGYQAMEREWLSERAQLNASVDSLKVQKASLETRLKGREERMSQYAKDLKAQKEEVAQLKKQVAALTDDGSDADSDKEEKKLWNPVTIGIAVAVALLLATAMVGVFVMQRRESIYNDQHETEDKNKDKDDFAEDK